MNPERTRMPEGAGRAQTSYWPIVLAATMTIAAAGFLVSPVISIIGIVISIVCIIAWGVQKVAGAGDSEEHGPVERLTLPGLEEGEREAETPVEIVRSPGWWGMVWFIGTEATFFTFLIFSYVYLRANSATWPPEGTPEPELLFPSVNTVILLSSGIPVFFAHRAIQQNKRRTVNIGLFLSALLGSVFLGGQVYEYLIAGATPATNIFWAGFFVLTGFHGAHVAVGIGLLLAMLVLSLRGRFSARHHFGVEFASTYWHFVDAVWIFLFGLLYLIR